MAYTKDIEELDAEIGKTQVKLNDMNTKRERLRGLNTDLPEGEMTSGVSNSFAGVSYPYSKHIKPPEKLGVKGKGDLETLEKNISALTSYMDLLVSGRTRASKTGGPLGPKYFLSTGSSCINYRSGKEVPRYIYISHVPGGNLPFLSAGSGIKIDELKGLIPGIISNASVLNPASLMNAITGSSTPVCRPIRMETIDTENKKTRHTKHVALMDIETIDPCLFDNRKNPISNNACMEGMTNYRTDTIENMQVFVVSSIVIYAIYKIVEKENLSFFG